MNPRVFRDWIISTLLISASTSQLIFHHFSPIKRTVYIVMKFDPVLFVRDVNNVQLVVTVASTIFHVEPISRSIALGLSFALFLKAFK